MNKLYGETDSFKPDYRLITIIIMLAVTVFLLSVFSRCIIEGMSMADTYTGRIDNEAPEEDVVVLSSMYFGIKPGDIIVFEQSGYPDPLIKRVIAVGGESIKFERDSDKNVTLYKKNSDGEWKLQVEDYIKDGEMTISKFYIVKFGDEIIIPENSVWVMGDNREHSSDSRTFGTVSLSSVQGLVVGTTVHGKNFELYKSMLLWLNIACIILYAAGEFVFAKRQDFFLERS